MRYNDAQRTWVLDNKDKYTSYAALTQDFNAVFGLSKSVNTFQQYLYKTLSVYLNTEKKATHFNCSETEWLIKNYDRYDFYNELTEALNKRFGTQRTVVAVREKCTKRLQKKGMKNATSFKKGNLKTQCPIGTIRKLTNGCSYIKVLDSTYSFQSGYEEPYWLPVQKKVWIDHYGKVPEGKMVIFLDGDRKNVDIANLYCIDRRISALLAANKWYSKNATLTLTAIKWCELFHAIKKQKGDSGHVMRVRAKNE